MLFINRHTHTLVCAKNSTACDDTLPLGETGNILKIKFNKLVQNDQIHESKHKQIFIL